MLFATLKKASQLKKIVSILHNVFHTLTIQLQNDQLRVLMITPDNSMLFDVVLHLDAGIGVGRELIFSVNTKHFLDSFNTLRANDSVRFVFDVDHLIVEIHSEECIERSDVWIGATQMLEFCDEPQYEHAIRVKDLNFQKLCKALSNANTELTVRGNSRRVALRAHLEKMYGREVEFGDLAATEDDFNEVYATEHFLNISKISTLSDTLFFCVEPEKPLCIKAHFAEEGVFKVFIKNKAALDQGQN